MSLILLHDTHIHLEMVLEKLGYGENFRDYKLGSSVENSATLTLTSDQKKIIDELLINHQFVIQSTVNTDNYDLVWNLFNSNPKVFFLLGSHPEIVREGFDLELYLSNQGSYLKSINPSSICGIGEVGLDYYYTKDIVLIELQKKLFISQIELALDLKLPLVIHCRDAFDDLIEILKKYPKIWGEFLIHCFTGNLNNLQSILELDGYVAVGGVSTYSNTEQLAEAIKYCRMSNIMIETDAPFLTPLAHRGNKVCLPEYVLANAQKIGELKGVQTQDIIDFSKHNCIQLFPLIRAHFGNMPTYLSDPKINE